MIEVRRLGHSTLTTPDLDRQVAYYTEVVGLTLLERDSKRAVLASNRVSRPSRSSPAPPMRFRGWRFRSRPGVILPM